MGYRPKPAKRRARIVAAKNSQMSLFRHCPKCSRLLRTAPLCGRCNLLVHRSHGFDVATHEEGPEATLQEIRDFLHPPPVNDGKPIILADDTTLLPGGGMLITAPLPRSKPSGKYEPRPLSHEAKVSPWLWRCVYAAGSLITLGAAAVTLWQHLGG